LPCQRTPMPTFSLRAALTAAPLLCICEGALALSNPEPTIAEDQRLLPYVKPGQLVDIGGRKINLHCSGAGGPTVILMAGSASWSPIWYKVQPAIAQNTRVCGFDRAGYGFSDPGPRPQILSDVVDDLHAALKAGAISGPYVLVGHSLGGVEARLYAQRWPKEVASMVLVDTSPAGEGLIDEAQPGFDEVSGWDHLAADLLHCALLAANGGLDPSRPDCKPELPSDTPAASGANGSVVRRLVECSDASAGVWRQTDGNDIPQPLGSECLRTGIRRLAAINEPDPVDLVSADAPDPV
jgi:pimeloyl-ACP methyl ester carboxylesterase